MKQHVFFICMVIILIILINISIFANDWRFPVGLTYASGFTEIADVYKDNLKDEGYSVSDSGFVFPVGLSFKPYLQFDDGMRTGFGIGPAMLIMISGTTESRTFFNVPLNLNIGYTFNNSGNTSPYVYIGENYNLTSGEYIKGNSLGPIIGTGLEFSRKKKVNFGVDLRYDLSEIEFENYKDNNTKQVKPCGIALSFFVIF